MEVTGTLMNYFFHCKRQCYFFGNKINLEDNEELVKIGKVLHEEKLKDKENAEIELENIKIDKITKDYVIEIKKSDADEEASKNQILFYLYKLRRHGIIRKGKLQFIEKNKDTKTEIIELDDEEIKKIEKIISEIQDLISLDYPPEEKLKISSCKKCAYYEYCYI